MLLDTHVLLWLLNDDPRLGSVTRETLSMAVVVHASAASIWEIAIAQSLGKIDAPDDLPTRVEEAGLDLLSVGPEHVWATREISGLPHRDPFDRLLVAQAFVESTRLVTADSALLAAPIEGPIGEAISGLVIDARR